MPSLELADEAGASSRQALLGLARSAAQSSIQNGRHGDARGGRAEQPILTRLTRFLSLLWAVLHPNGGSVY